MEPTDLTIEILKSIRDEIRSTNTRMDGLTTRVDGLHDDLVGLCGEVTDLRDELSRRIVESEVRTSTAISELAGTVREMTAVLRASHDLRPRVERCERDIDELKRRLPS